MTMGEKIKQLLNFLKEETYSDFKTLMLLFGFRDHKSLYSLLAKTEQMGLIQKHVLESRTMKISLWGITSDGLAVVLTPNDKIFPARFEPSKITGWTLEHHLDNQAARLILEKKGASGWINGDRATFLSQYQVKHRPDGLLTLPDGNVIAIDTVPPQITPLNPKQWGSAGRITFKAKDGETGISSYRGTIDGKYALFGKPNSISGNLVCELDPKHVKKGGRHVVEMTVTDGCGNQTTERFEFVW